MHTQTNTNAYVLHFVTMQMLCSCSCAKILVLPSQAPIPCLVFEHWVRAESHSGIVIHARCCPRHVSSSKALRVLSFNPANSLKNPSTTALETNTVKVAFANAKKAGNFKKRASGPSVRFSRSAALVPSATAFWYSLFPKYTVVNIPWLMQVLD